MDTISATEFKAKCLAILDRVARTGEIVTVTKRGKPVAQVAPAVPASKRPKYPQDAIKGRGRVLGDLIEPILPPEAWDAERGEGDLLPPESDASRER